jgi:hydroxyacylglutathione hydrolase
MKATGIAILMALILTGVVIHQRHVIIINLLTGGEPPPLLDPATEDPAARWFDDYFLIHPIDERTFAIGEPRYYQQVFNYLILGSERALLFDAGPGYRDIRAVAESLTNLPITFVPSHFHYDHVGNSVTFDSVAVLDLPYLRRRATDNLLTLTDSEHMGSAEGIPAPTLLVDQWLKPGSVVSLGARDLRVLHTPGHTVDSMSLVDMTSGDVFTGDFIYPGELYAFLPNSNMGDYLQGAKTLLSAVDDTTRLLGAHRSTPPGLPQLKLRDLSQLHDTLLEIQDGTVDGTGIYPTAYPVNENLSLLAEPSFLQNWQANDLETF